MCVVITGAANGIGRAVAELMAGDGTPQVLIDIDEIALNKVKANLASSGVQITCIVGSVADEETSQRASEAAMAFGGATGFSYNAGIQRYGSATDTGRELWDEVLDVNLNGAYLMSRALLPQLIASKGACVFMASIQGLATQQKVAAYTVSKHGLIGLAKSIAVDYADAGVRSNAVAPGSVKTPMLDWAVEQADNPEAVWNEINTMHPLGRAAEASEVAELAVFLLSKRASFISGEVIRIDGGLMARLGGSPK